MANYQALAFDYGLKNIGVATGQSLIQSATELPAIAARDGIPNWQRLEQVLKEWKPTKVIVGLPLNMDGSESEMCARARKFGRRLEGRFGCEVNLMDERLSTREAKEMASELGHKGNYGNEPIDSLAAVVILQSWWQRVEEDPKQPSLP